MEILNLVQGSHEWHAHRPNYRNASDTPAVTGSSTYKSYSDFVKERATGIIPEVDPATQRRFDDGHRFEALARPLMEKIIGEDIFPLVGVDGVWSASFDGLTMCHDINAEHKTLNDSIRACNSAAELPLMYREQCEHQMKVSGAGRTLFMATKWSGPVGEEVLEEEKHFWLESDMELRQKIEAAWDRFDADVAAYVPEVVEAKPILTANPIDHLPALTIEVTGRVTHSNLVEFKACAVAVISSIKTELVTDQDFVDATNAVKYLKDVEDNAKRAKQNALDQTTSIAELHRALDEVAKMAADVRKSLDKKITEEKESRKEEIIITARADLLDHCRKLNLRIGGFMPTVTADFAGATKNLRSLDSMREKVGNVLREAQYQTSQTADRIEANIKSLEESSRQSWRFLFPDLMAVCNKAPDDFAALLAARKASHKEAEAKRIEQIRAEEQAKAQREAEQKAQMAEHERLVAERAAQAEANRLAAEEIRRIDEQRKAEAMTIALVLADESKVGIPLVEQKQEVADHIEQPLVLVVSDTHAPVNDCLPRIKLGEICARLGYTVSAEFLATMGFEPVATDKNAKLYNESSFPGICRRISDHTLRVAMTKKAA